MKPYKPKIKQLIKRLGGPTAIATELGITHGAVCQWKRIPEAHCTHLEAWSAQRGKIVTCEEMRPDIYRRLVVIPSNTQLGK